MRGLREAGARVGRNTCESRAMQMRGWRGAGARVGEAGAKVARNRCGIEGGRMRVWRSQGEEGAEELLNGVGAGMRRPRSRNGRGKPCAASFKFAP